jgi:hypothetical protein
VAHSGPVCSQREGGAAEKNIILQKLPQGLCQEMPVSCDQCPGGREGNHSIKSPPTTFKERVPKNKAPSGSAVHGAGLVIPGQTLIKLLLVLALNSHRSRQKRMI